MTTTIYYVAGTNTQGAKKVTAFMSVESAFAHAAKWKERPLETRADAVAYMAGNDVANIAQAEAHVAESETWAVALPL